jgi:hypothetical protein
LIDVVDDPAVLATACRKRIAKWVKQASRQIRFENSQFTSIRIYLEAPDSKRTFELAERMDFEAPSPFVGAIANGPK